MAAAPAAAQSGFGSWLGGNRNAAPAQPVGVAQAFDTGAAEWSDRFDPASASTYATADARQPTLSPRTAGSIQQAILNYRQIAYNGGWGRVPGDQVLRVGVKSPNVAALRQRLIGSGDLHASAGLADTFDSYVDAAVKRFQKRHGLLADGIVGGSTLEAMNVSVEERIQQLEMNLVRVHSMGGDLGERYVLVNIPAAEVEAVENGYVAGRYTAVVGKPDRASPILTDQIDYISFNPFWTVPKSIIRKDIIPQMQKDPEYLTNYRIRIYDGRGNEIDPKSVDWYSDEAVAYMLRQDPGDFNSLGSIRINFPNEHSVYLHDTPQTSLFGTNDRFHSSGCVRVQNVRHLVSWLLAPNGEDWSRNRIDGAVRSGEYADVTLKYRTPIYFSYITAWADDSGTVQFRPDIYDRDGNQSATVATTNG
ncbi:L,D-transpeptidase family protein [Lutibaculum baratangense]